jgi:hypothetical protein
VRSSAGRPLWGASDGSDMHSVECDRSTMKETTTSIVL